MISPALSGKASTRAAILTLQEERRVTLAEIVEQACKTAAISKAELLSPSRYIRTVHKVGYKFVGEGKTD